MSKSIKRISSMKAGVLFLRVAAILMIYPTLAVAQLPMSTKDAELYYAAGSTLFALEGDPYQVKIYDRLRASVNPKPVQKIREPNAALVMGVGFLGFITKRRRDRRRRR